MLSICIPIYNQNVSTLVKTLDKQINDLKIAAELILIDDASSENIKASNESICQKHNYHKLEKNIGRAKIRNLFLNYVHYNYLLFLDCDAIITDHLFLEKYVSCINSTQPKIICGGRVYPHEAPEKNCYLNWIYGTKKESKTYIERKQHPNRSFMTNNFVIKKSIFETIRFDENLTEYGHEDTLFGYELLKNKITITHIDNAILNGDIETNAVFLSKTEKGINNLPYLIKKVNYDPDFINEIKLLNSYFFFKKKGLLPLLFPFFLLLKTPIKHCLKKGLINLHLFDFYKLIILHKALKINS